MKINPKEVGDICILEIEGEVDAEHSAQLKKAIVKAREDYAKHFILNLSGVSFIDSTGLGVLISLMRHLNENGGKLKLAGLQDEVRSIFEITRLYKVFDLCPSAEDALREMPKKK
ncbi:MAG: STAS domain-containing protein [Deltaproteobacteria bacterium]|nr:STAS domain-containing protein [Deltaproteobacteria bacterium]